jgi:hypothetical protein
MFVLIIKRSKRKSELDTNDAFHENGKHKSMNKTANAIRRSQTAN